MNKGISLIEMVFVVAIAGILTAIVSGSFGTAQIRKEQDGIVQMIAAHLENRRRTRRQEKAAPHMASSLHRVPTYCIRERHIVQEHRLIRQ